MNNNDSWLITDAYPHRLYCPKCYRTNLYNVEVLTVEDGFPRYCMWCGEKIKPPIEHASMYAKIDEEWVKIGKITEMKGEEDEN